VEFAMQTISSLRLLRLLFAVAGLVLCAWSTAEARHVLHHGHLQRRDVSSDDRKHQDPVVHRELLNSTEPTEPRSQTSGFSTAVAQVIHDCKEQATELQNTPTNVVIETVKPNKDQLAAIERIRSATNEAAKKLNASCPGDVPAGMSERLTTADQALGATKDALALLRPAFVSAYAALDDEQKAQLVALAISNTQRTPQVEPASNNPSVSSKNEAEAHVPFGCGQWSSLLKAWPLNKIELDQSLSDEERAELYELMASVYHASGHLTASCQAEDALTPVARLDGEVNRIDILRQCIDAIAPALGKFTGLLNDDQKERFNKALGTTAQAKTPGDAD
jgi:hypothetical protein